MNSATLSTPLRRRPLDRRVQLSLRKYAAVLRVSITNNLAYARELFFRALFLIVLVFIITQLWKTTFAVRGAKTLSGFSINDMIWYIVATEILATSLPALTRRIDQEVRSGQLAYLLGRPCSYVLYNFAHYLGERLVRVVLNSVVGITIAVVIAGLPHFHWAGVIAWPLVTFLALCIDFVVYFTIGLLAFWTEETQAFAFLYSRCALVLGGVLVPLEVFPQPLRSIAQALPFSTVLYGPARTVVHFELQVFSALLLQQILTLAIGSGFLLLLYRTAVRRVNINGG